MEKYLQEFERWLLMVDDQEVKEQLLKMKGDEKLIEDAFYRDLAFGTGGLRGELGAGTNRMNIYTVRKASQGLANYINHHFKNPSIAISYDSRINSTLFAKAAAGVFAANGIKVFIYKELMPTPLLSFAVRTLKCSSGIMVTASHNPSKYNGYKAYDENGCQIANEVADETLDEIRHQIRKMTEKGEGKVYNISANNFTIEESKLNNYNIISISNCIFETEDI